MTTLQPLCGKFLTVGWHSMHSHSPLSLTLHSPRKETQDMYPSLITTSNELPRDPKASFALLECCEKACGCPLPSSQPQTESACLQPEQVLQVRCYRWWCASSFQWMCELFDRCHKSFYKPLLIPGHLFSNSEVTPEMWAELGKRMHSLCTPDDCPPDEAHQHSEVAVRLREQLSWAMSDRDLLSSPGEVSHCDLFRAAFFSSPARHRGSTCPSDFSLASSLGTSLSYSAEACNALVDDVPKMSSFASASEKALTPPRSAQTPSLANTRSEVSPHNWARSTKMENIRLLLAVAEADSNAETQIPLELDNPVHICLIKSLVAQAERRAQGHEVKSQVPVGLPEV